MGWQEGRDEKTQEEINMSRAAQNEKRVKGWGQRDGQLRVMAYISLSLFNESRIDRAITPDTRTHPNTHTHSFSAEVC